MTLVDYVEAFEDLAVLIEALIDKFYSSSIGCQISSCFDNVYFVNVTLDDEVSVFSCSVKADNSQEARCFAYLSCLGVQFPQTYKSLKDILTSKNGSRPCMSPFDSASTLDTNGNNASVEEIAVSGLKQIVFALQHVNFTDEATNGLDFCKFSELLQLHGFKTELTVTYTDHHIVSLHIFMPDVKRNYCRFKLAVHSNNTSTAVKQSITHFIKRLKTAQVSSHPQGFIKLDVHSKLKIVKIMENRYQCKLLGYEKLFAQDSHVFKASLRLSPEDRHHVLTTFGFYDVFEMYSQGRVGFTAFKEKDARSNSNINLVATLSGKLWYRFSFNWMREEYNIKQIACVMLLNAEAPGIFEDLGVS